MRTMCPPPRFNPNEETMGSTPYGSVSPIDPIGAALPPHIEFDRDSGGVKLGGQS